jgi:hypothetical protein
MIFSWYPLGIMVKSKVDISKRVKGNEGISLFEMHSLLTPDDSI